MRKLKRPDMPQIVYKFWARPSSDLPNEFWDIAKKMNELWNQLQLTYNERIESNEEQKERRPQERETIRALWEQAYADAQPLDKDGKKHRWAQYNKETKPLWDAFDKNSKRIVDTFDGLNGECKEEILNRFGTACRRAFKEHGRIRPHHSLQKIMIPHRLVGVENQLLDFSI